MVERIGRFLLLKKIATGGMAEVYLAQQKGIEGFEKPVVIKRLRPELARSGQFMVMFLNEAKLAARLAHPNIVQIYDLGIADGAYFIAMEFVQGENLATVMKNLRKQGRKMPVQLVTRIGCDACEGLYHAHTKTDVLGRPLGIVHADISPQNILVSLDGTVKIIDFGVAKAASEARKLDTGKIIMGKLCYLAPEQCYGKEPDARTDLYCLGVVLWELASGRRLFRNLGDAETMKAITRMKVPAPSRFNSEVPRKLDEAILKAVSKKPADRFQDARQFHQALKEVEKECGWESSAFEIASFMQELFRDKIEAAIRKELSIPLYYSDSLAGSDMPDTGEAEAARGPETASVEAAREQPGRKKRARATGQKRLWPAMIALVVAAAVAVVGYLVFGEKLPRQKVAGAGTGDGFGVIVVDSDPKGASVWLDGRLRCKSPCSIERVSTTGWHSIEISKEGFQPYNFRFELGGAESRRDFAVKLNPLGKVDWASVRVVTEPPGAYLELNGKLLQKKTPAMLERLVPGQSYQLRAFAKGHRDWTTVLKLGPGEVKTVRGELVPVSR